RKAYTLHNPLFLFCLDARCAFFAQSSYKGESFVERLNHSGYKWQTMGENIARGAGSSSRLDDPFKAWMESTGHRKNILNDSFREVAIGGFAGNFQRADSRREMRLDVTLRTQSNV
ncbi:MAG TPA: CAP domain-containing protein, partial [Rubrobacteraceae bacterium]|nr:CAP domain-containing protein [Rubrobacteraceae bacterium]